MSQEILKYILYVNNPYSFVLLLLFLILSFFSAWRIKRIKVILEKIEKLPEKDRAKILYSEMEVPPNIQPEQWLKSKIYNYVFGLLISIIICITIIVIVYKTQLSSDNKATILVERIDIRNDENSPSYRFGKWVMSQMPIHNNFNYLEQNIEARFILDNILNNKTDVIVFDKSLFLSLWDKNETINSLEWRVNPDYDFYTQKSISNSIAEEIKNTEFFKLNNKKHAGEWNTIMAYVNSLIEPPVIHIIIRNTGTQSATIYGFKFINILSTGGEVGGGASPLQVDNTESLITLNWNKNSELTFNNPLVLDAGNTSMLELKLIVNNASQGDGQGNLLYQIMLDYADGQNSHASTLIAIVNQSDGVGFPVDTLMLQKSVL